MKKGERRKQELLKIAYQMFLSEGYENTSVDGIIEKAGIAKGTYYYYFESKEQMLEEVIDMMLDAETEKAEQVIAADIPIPQKLVGVLASFRPDISEAPIKNALHEPDNIIMHEKVSRKLTDRLVPLLSEVAELGISEGIFACDDIPERVRMIIILSESLFDSREASDTDIRVFIDAVEKILYAVPGSMGFLADYIRKGE